MPILDRTLGAGLHIPVVNGNTSECYALTTDEACIMVREAFALVAGRVPVLGRSPDGHALKLAASARTPGQAALRDELTSKTSRLQVPKCQEPG